MDTLQKYYKITAKEEYEKNPKLSEADVQELVKWSNDSLQLHGKLIDLQIIMFLHACDYNKEYAKKVIHQCYTLKAKKCACFFSGRDPAHSYIQKQFDMVNINIIPDEDTDYSYIWTNLNNYDASQYYPTISTKVLLMAIELDQTEHGSRAGYRLILDASHFGLSHAFRFSLSQGKHLMTFVQEATCFKIDKIYILNVTAGVDTIFSMMKPFMSSSLINKILIKSSSKSAEFLTTLPKNVVPKDYNGLAPYLNDGNEILRKKILDNRDYFLNEEKFRNGKVKEEKETIIDESEKNDVHSFKQLCID